MYIQLMTIQIEYDEVKNALNITKHGIGFNAVSDLDQDTVFTVEDTRFSYGEPRFITMGMIGGRLHILVWTDRLGVMRMISLRKANAKERKIYDQTKNKIS